MNRYSYNGPVMEFDNCVEHHFKAETMAVSEGKARTNLIYQWKQKNKKPVDSNVRLPGKIILVRGGA